MANYWEARTAIKSLDEGWAPETWDLTQMVIRGKISFKAKGTMPNVDLSAVDYYFIDTATMAVRKYSASQEDQEANWVKRWPVS